MHLHQSTMLSVGRFDTNGGNMGEPLPILQESGAVAASAWWLYNHLEFFIIYLLIIIMF